jgi:hypothetical protein
VRRRRAALGFLVPNEAKCATRAPIEVPEIRVIVRPLDGAPSETLSGSPPATQYSPREPAPVASGTKDRTGLFGVLFAVGAFLLKFKFLFTFLKFGKILTTMSSMLLSIGAYALVWGWKFATGFVLLIFVHEMGHVFAAWRKKLPVSAPMFIPFWCLHHHERASAGRAHRSADRLRRAALRRLGSSIVWGAGLVDA